MRAKIDMDGNAGQNAQVVLFSCDLVILTNSPRHAFFKGKAHARNILNALKSILKKLKPNLSANKSRIATAEEGVDFLGFHFIHRQNKRGSRR